MTKNNYPGFPVTRIPPENLQHNPEKDEEEAENLNDIILQKLEDLE